MALQIYNVRSLVAPEKLKLKILVHGLHGTGKSSFLATAPNLGVGVCETGVGKGQLSVAQYGHDAADLKSYNDFEEFCSGTVFKDKDTIGLDSLSDASKTFIKDKALSIPRAKGESQKRLLGVPELDDYGVMAELTRKNIRRLLDIDKHIVVTSGLRIDKPDQENGQGEMLLGPDLPGAMFLGSTALFDLVLCLRTRSILRDPKDAKSRFQERYFVTDSTGGILAKNRLSISNKGSFLPTEVIFDRNKDMGTFSWFLKTAQDAYATFLAAQPLKG
jgi:hypothetical protein